MHPVDIYVTYDSFHCTYNVMNGAAQCVFFGTAWEVDEWLEKNKEIYIEKTII